jgi:hypothetical protein
MAAVGRPWRCRLAPERGPEEGSGSLEEIATQFGRVPLTVQRWLRWLRWIWEKELEP